MSQPDTAFDRTDGRYVRWGAAALLVVLAGVLALQALANARLTLPINRDWNGFRLATISLASLKVEQRPNNVPEISVSEGGLALAQKAYAREPLATDALFVAAIDSLKDSAKTEKLIDTAVTLDRRNMNIGGLQLQRAAVANDVPGALAILSRLTTIQPRLAAPLVEGILPALSDEKSMALIEQAIKRDDVLAEAFWSRAPMNVAALGNLVKLRARTDNGATRRTDTYLLTTLINNGRLDDAFSVWKDYLAGPGDDVATGFTASEEVPGIGWALNDDVNLSMRNSGDGTFQVFARRERSGELGRQLLRLRPGRFQISVKSDTRALDDALKFALTCASDDPTKAQPVTLSSARSWTVGRDGCQFYWLVIGADSWRAPTDLQGQISQIEFAPVVQ